MKCNGWKNRATWNVALWIRSDYGLYQAAVEFMKNYKGRCPYKEFIEYFGLDEEQTPDGCKWCSKELDYKALNSMMRELVE